MDMMDTVNTSWHKYWSTCHGPLASDMYTWIRQVAFADQPRVSEVHLDKTHQITIFQKDKFIIDAETDEIDINQIN